jgi:hypothetical protein
MLNVAYSNNTYYLFPQFNFFILKLDFDVLWKK